MNMTDAQRHYERSMSSRGFGLVPQGDDAALAVHFENVSKLMKKQSEDERRPVYKDVVYVRIGIVGGDEYHGPASDEDKRRFWQQWEAFEAGDSEQIVGMPLKMWPAMSPAQVDSYKYMRVHTVEQLAAMSDVSLQDLGSGAKELKRKAVAYLAHAKDAGAIEKYAAENERLTTDLDILKQQMVELQDIYGRPEPKKQPAKKPSVKGTDKDETK